VLLPRREKFPLTSLKLKYEKTSSYKITKLTTRNF
jgi:hypothetical protein